MKLKHGLTKIVRDPKKWEYEIGPNHNPRTSCPTHTLLYEKPKCSKLGRELPAEMVHVTLEPQSNT